MQHGSRTISLCNREYHTPYQPIAFAAHTGTIAHVASLRENLALNLKIRRSILGISQAELAERAGISPGYVGGLETKRNWPSDDKAELLAKALGVDPGLLFMDPNSEGIMFDLKDLDMVLSRSHDQILQDVERAYGMRSIPAPGNSNGNANGNGNAGSGRNR